MAGWNWFASGFAVGAKRLRAYVLWMLVMAFFTVMMFISIAGSVHGYEFCFVDGFVYFIAAAPLAFTVMPLFSVMLLMELRLPVKRNRILYYGGRRNSWMNLFGEILAVSLAVAIMIILCVAVSSAICSKGVFSNFDSRYSLAYATLQGVISLSPYRVLARCIAAILIQFLFIGLLAGASAAATKKEYLGVILSLFSCCGEYSSFIVFSLIYPGVDTSYRSFVFPDASLYTALIKLAVLVVLAFVVNSRKGVDIL